MPEIKQEHPISKKADRYGELSACIFSLLIVGPTNPIILSIGLLLIPVALYAIALGMIATVKIILNRQQFTGYSGAFFGLTQGSGTVFFTIFLADRAFF